jgi:hypothetical protein
MSGKQVSKGGDFLVATKHSKVVARVWHVCACSFSSTKIM